MIKQFLSALFRKMGNTVCSKCNIPIDSGLITKEHLLQNRKHCRIHSDKVYNNDGEFVCNDCGCDKERSNCVHTWEYRLCCLKF